MAAVKSSITITDHTLSAAMIARHGAAFCRASNAKRANTRQSAGEKKPA
jgi:hypothetical protein